MDHRMAWHGVGACIRTSDRVLFPLRRDLITVSPASLMPAESAELQSFSPSPLAHVPDEPCGPALPCPASLPCPARNLVELGPQTATSTGRKLKKSARPLG